MDTIARFLTACAATACCFISCSENRDDNTLTLRYGSPAEYFEESLVIGNGTLGAIVYGGVESDRVSLNDITLWTGEPEGAPYTPDAYRHLPEVRACLHAEDYVGAQNANMKIEGHNSQYYQPLGTLYLDSILPKGGGYSDYRRSLDISRALAADSFRTAEGTFSREYFASAPDSVIVIRLDAAEGAKINTALRYECVQPHETVTQGDELIVSGYTAYGYDEALDSKPEAFLYDPGRGIHFRTIVKVLADDGEVTADKGTLRLYGCTAATVIISNVTSFNGPHNDPVKAGRDYTGDVRKRIDRAAAKGYWALKEAHEEDYTGLFGRLGIDLGTTDPAVKALTTDMQLLHYGDSSQTNPDLEELYFQYGRYLLISSARTPGVPANLQGLWNERVTAPWRSNYTMNINLEENYWPAESANLSELHHSLLEFIKRLSVSGRISAENYYGVHEGWSSGHNSDIWAMTNPAKGRPRWACWPMGSAWLSTHIWEHYAFTMDKDFLAEAYPVLKGAAEFCLAWLIEKDGWLITSPATSPEADFINPAGTATATLYGGTADLAFTRECLMDTRAAAEVLGIDAGLRERIDSTLERLLPYRIGRRGNLQEWYHDWEDADWQHRHQSHLFGLYPGHHISVDETPGLAAACARTLEIKGDKTTGWSTGWRVNLQARLRDAEKAYHIYRVLLTYISPDGYDREDARRGGGTYPNLLDAHSPFQIDGNFGGCAGVLEMLVQSSIEDGVTLLPALPQAWRTQGSLRGVRVRGGYELDFSWEDGDISRLTVKSLRQDTATLRLRLGDQVRTVTLAPGECRKVRI